MRKIECVTAKDTKAVILSLKPGQITLEGSEAGAGDGKVDVECDYKGPEFSIGFRTNYILEFLNTSSTETVRIGFNSNDQIAIFSDPTIKEYLYLLMPILTDKIGKK